MDEALGAVFAGLRERFPEHVSEPQEEFGEASARVAREAIVEAGRYLRDEQRFEMLSDLSAADFLGVAPRQDRFLVAYHVTSISRTLRLRLRVFVPEGDETVPTLSEVWPTANWHEREVYDFFGITFTGHADLRRILMPDDWEGYPQRKDYPLGGTKVEFKGATVPPPDVRRQPTTTSGYPGRIS